MKYTILCAGAVMLLIGGSAQVTSAGLMHYWDFEDAAAGTLQDFADTANSYAEGSGATAQPLTPNVAQFIETGRDGGNSAKSGWGFGYGAVNPAPGMNDLGGTFSVESWFRYDGASCRGWARVFGDWDRTFLVHCGNNQYSLAIGGTTYISNPAGYADPAGGTWMHMVVVADAAAGTVVQYWTPDGSAAPVILGSSNVYTGTSAAGQPFYVGDDYKYTARAIYDYVAIWDHAMTPEEVADHYENGLSLTPALIPEPATMSLLVVGGLAAMLRRRRR